MKIRPGVLALLALGLFATRPLLGGTPYLHDQTDFTIADSYGISSAVQAVDFVITAGTRLDAADVWLSDLVVNDDGKLNSFGGVLSWAVYSNASGSPGALLFSGTDSTVGLGDTGQQDVYFDDIVRARIELDGRVVLAPGTYWFVLHEGAWGSPSDGSEIFWELSASVVGSPVRGSDNEMTPGSWIAGTPDLAFALYGGPTAWEQSAVAGGGEGSGVSDLVIANDFTLGAATGAGSLDAWLLEYGGLDNGFSDAFSETVSWAVYADKAGVPDSTPIASGTDATPQIEDSGLDAGIGDIVRVRIELSPRLLLGPGTYWLALHEGAWLSAFDGSTVSWYDSTTSAGGGQWIDDFEVAPGFWSGPYPYDSAFVLFDEPIFFSGFERGSSLAWESLGDSTCRQGRDTDNDRLDDCFESNTGRFMDVRNTGTDPANADTDGDGLLDGDETLGTLAGLDLPAMGTSPLKKDILLEYDWFDDNLDSGICTAHSHRPTPAALAAVTAMFANAPNSNPDGSTGIHFVHDYGQGGVFNGGNLVADPNGVIAGGVNDAEFLAHKAAHFAANRNGYFHYTLLPHAYNTSSTSSGQAELPGDDLVVSLQCYGSDANVANTIAHELGHNLNLRHGGNSNCNYKPNYNSVMNYKYQFPGVDNDCTPPGNGVLDYSRGTRIALNENSLDESLGICGAPAVDWNGSGTITAGVTADVNPEWGGNQVLDCGAVLSTLSDFDDWANVDFAGLSEADGAVLAREIVSCDNPAPAR